MRPQGMPIFTFLFTQDGPLESARVAADTSDAAWVMINSALGMGRPPGTIFFRSGRADTDSAKFLSVIRRSDGAQLIDDGIAA